MTTIYMDNGTIVDVDARSYNILESGILLCSSSNGRAVAIVPHNALIVFGD